MAVHSDRRIYDADCRRCARLAHFLESVRKEHPDYFNRPVPSFGSLNARLLVVGLAPGMHGANASGRPFTGDWCSDLLYGTLHAHGYASRPRSISREDSQELIDCRLTNAVKCLPPQNKPTPSEIRTCSAYLGQEISTVMPKVIVCLGAVAHGAVLDCLDLGAQNLKKSMFRFAHGAQHRIGERWVIDSYHPSRYNTNTGRLTAPMFSAIFDVAKRCLDGL